MRELRARGIERGSSGGGVLRPAVASGASSLELCSRRKKAGGGSEVGLGRPEWDEVVRYDEVAVAWTPRMTSTWARRRSRRVTRHALLHCRETEPSQAQNLKEF